MKTPIYVRPITDDERQALEASLRSSEPFVLRRSQIILSSADGERAPKIAESLECSSQSVRNAIRAFNQSGLDALAQGPSRPRTFHPAFPGEAAEQLREMVEHSPRHFGKNRGSWTLELLAQTSFERGLTPRLVTGETVRATLVKLGIHWKQTKRRTMDPKPQPKRRKKVEQEEAVA